LKKIAIKVPDSNELNLQNGKSVFFIICSIISYLPYFSLSTSGYSFVNIHIEIFCINEKKKEDIFIKFADPNQSGKKIAYKNNI
jgi:hypothetical protein